MPVTREELVIERHSVTGSESPGEMGESAEIRVPLTEERVTVEKRAQVREEVEVGKRIVEAQQKVTGEVRSEELRVDNDPNVKVQGELEGGTEKRTKKKSTL